MSHKESDNELDELDETGESVDLVTKSILNTIGILQPFNERLVDPSEEYQDKGFDDITVDILKFSMDLLGKDGPVYLNIEDIYVDEPGITELEIGVDGETIKIFHILDFLQNVIPILSKRERDHFAGFHDCNRKIVYSYANQPKGKQQYRMGWD